MWRGVGVGRFKCARPTRRTDSECGMESSEEPLMVPLGCGLNKFKVGVCEEPRCFTLGVFLQVVVGREVALQFAFVVNREMAGRNPLSREGNR